MVGYFLCMFQGIFQLIQKLLPDAAFRGRIQACNVLYSPPGVNKSEHQESNTSACSFTRPAL
jgi:hypothetical protein